jgi:glucose/arabinose dehydrogenase
MATRLARFSCVALAVTSIALSACSGEEAGPAGDGVLAPDAGGKADEIADCDAEIHLESTFGGVAFTRPTAIVKHPTQNAFYVVEKRGAIWLAPANATGASDISLVADLRSRTNDSADESGMLGLDFHPDFAQNGEIFISYTGASSQSPVNLVSRVSRFRSTDGGQTIDPGSEEILLSVQQPFENHNGGDIHFGPDGFLYIGYGDGGAAGDPGNRSQNLDTLLGKMLRIDVDNGDPYGIPSDNPFASGGGRPEIFAWGLRNPWRFSFDRANGTLFAADVGQDAFEEIDIVENGRNYGWRVREGEHCFNPSFNCSTSGLTDPIAEYGHADGISVTGGFVYRGSDIPSLQGQYVFTDFASGRFWALSGSGSSVTRREIGELGRNIVAFAEDGDGELLVADFFSGQILRIEENTGCEEPDPNNNPVDPGDLEDPTSFSSIYNGILVPRCGPCHTSGAAGGLSLATEASALDNLVGSNAASAACSGRALVEPGDPANSVLFQKVSGVNLCGSMMPPGPPLSNSQVAAIQEWIEDGAQP